MNDVIADLEEDCNSRGATRGCKIARSDYTTDEEQALDDG